MKKHILCILAATVMALILCSCSFVPRVLPSLPNIGGQKDPAPTTQASATTVTTATAATSATVITLNSYSATLQTDSTLQLIATANTEQPLKWRSSNENVVLVNGQGLVTAVGVGVANVTCYTDGNAEVSCTVTVSAPTTTAPLVEDGFLFPQSSSTLLTEETIAATLATLTYDSPTGNYAQDAVNEIYARNGYIFKSEVLQAYYESKSWYTADVNFSVSTLNAYEKSNVSLLKKFK